MFCSTYMEYLSLYLGLYYILFLNILFIYFWREGKGRRNTEREISTCGCLSCAPHWGPSLQPRLVPWLGIKPATPWFTGQHSIHWATPARARSLFYSNDVLYFSVYKSYTSVKFIPEYLILFYAIIEGIILLISFPFSLSLASV